MTQEQLAEAADLDRSYYADIEAGRRNPTLEVLGKIASALNTDLSTLFEGL